ncbi:MAG TPA: hypothetical protein VKZ60_01225 [Chloroflexota bacterium]|jgi:hypothetical protein|nr:hypothetical protein [Chloroflexota bacterium]
MACLGLVLVAMGLVLLVIAWQAGRSLLLALGSLAYVAVGCWMLITLWRRPRQP